MEEGGGGGGHRAAGDARTSTCAWKKAVGVFVRRAAQTDRVKERLFGSAVQEQQNTLPLDRVVKNECRGGIWPVAWREGGANMPKSAHDEPPRLPESDRRWRGDDKDRGKQVARGKNQLKRASVKVEPFIPGKRHEGISRTRSQHNRLEEREMIQDISPGSLCSLRPGPPLTRRRGEVHAAGVSISPACVLRNTRYQGCLSGSGAGTLTPECPLWNRQSPFIGSSDPI